MAAQIGPDGQKIFSVGCSPIETLMLIPPISSCIFHFLNTPDYLCMRNTSKTMRCFVDDNRRFFRNLVFLQKGAERWLDLLESDVDNIVSEEHQNILIKTAVLDIVEMNEQLEWSNKRSNKRAVDMIIASLSVLDDELKAPVWAFWHNKSQEIQTELAKFSKRRVKVDPFQISDFYHPSLMGRHLAQIIKNLPIGRNVASIVLDGTGVDTDWIQLIMARYTSTLRGLSVRDCPNIDAYVFADWILEALYSHQPFPLKWLRIWGSGGVPHFLHAFSLMDPVEPLPPHPDDDHAGPKVFLPQYLKLFANVVPKDFHLSYVHRLLMPMFKHGQDKTNWLSDMQTVLTRAFRDRDEIYRDNADPFPTWNAPLMPLGDINPIIALLALSRYLGIQLDFSLCASQHFCWSFVLAANSELPQPRPTPVFQLVVGGVTYNIPQVIDAGDQLLHTHALADIGSRKVSGGQVCHVCGLWEDKSCPPEFCDGQEITDIGGIKTGNGIGIGRYSIGTLCADCRDMQTCSLCKKFVCHNCAFADPSGPRNPFMSFDPGDVQHLKVICDREGHAAECMECISTRADLYFECEECEGGLCLRCNPPNGHLVSTDIYGGSLHMTSNGGEDYDCMGMEFGKVTALTKFSLFHIKAFKPDVPQTMDIDSNDKIGVSQANLYEYCDNCDSAICRSCIGAIAGRNLFVIYSRLGASLFTTCTEGCEQVFCDDCQEETLATCRGCNRMACKECIFDRTRFKIAVGIDLVWCRGPGCMVRSGVSALLEVRGPWEDGWVPPSASELTGAALNAILEVIGNSNPMAALEALRRARQQYAAAVGISLERLEEMALAPNLQEEKVKNGEGEAQEEEGVGLDFADDEEYEPDPLEGQQPGDGNREDAG